MRKRVFRQRADGLLSIGQVAERAGLPVSALRYYADRGLVPYATTGGRHRRFTEEALTWAKLIRRLRENDEGLASIEARLRDPVKRAALWRLGEASQERQRNRRS